MIDLKLLGGRIRELRLQKNLTQSEFANILMVSFQAVSNWERGVTPPDLENLTRIASFFGILVDDLLRLQAEKLYLGIDGGGTSTEFVVVNADGRVFEKFSRPGCNPNDIGLKNAANIICDGIRDVLLKFPRICYTFCGIAGVSVGDTAAKMTKLLQERFPSLNLRVNTDSANLFGMDDRADLVVISGTGSVVFVRQENRYARVGGWGYLLDEAGSGYDIGRDAIAHALAQEDTNEQPSLLTQMLKAKLNTPCVYDAIQSLYSGGKPFIASMARVVFDACRKGDPAACAIVEKSAARIGQMLNTGVKLYGVRPHAVAGGGIFQHHTDIFLPRVQAHTDVKLKVYTLPPVFGACRQSILHTGDPINPSFQKHFTDSYGECV